MQIAVRYYTRSGNTKVLAEAIAEAAGVQAKEVSEELTEKIDILFLGSSVYAAGVDDEIKKFIAKNHDKIGQIVNFSTAALLSSTYKQVKKLAEDNGVVMGEEEFHCRGSFGPMHKGRPNEKDKKDAAEFVVRVLEQYKK